MKWAALLLLSVPACAATHWVSPTGTATWASCVGSSPLSDVSACSISTALSSAAGGDTVYLRAGTYARGSADGIAPAHSGSGISSMLRLWAYNAETVTFTGTGVAVVLTGRSYVSVKGITFSPGWTGWGELDHGASHNEVANCVFTSTTGSPRIPNTSVAFFVGAATPSDASTYGWSTNNWIHDNTFTITGQGHGSGGRGCTDGGYDTLRIGTEYGSGGWPGGVDGNTNNTIENNFIEHGEHTALDTYGAYSVIRGNIVHNEPWSSGCPQTSTVPPTYSSTNPNYTAYNGMYGHRDFHITEDYGRTGTYMLIEGNRLGYASPNQNTGGVENLAIGAPQNIIRYNLSYGSLSSGFTLKWAWGDPLNSGGNGGTYNRIYNNTIYRSGYGYPLGLTNENATAPYPDTAIAVDDCDQSAAPVGNVLKNNLFYQSGGYTFYGSDVIRCSHTMAGGSPQAHTGWDAVTAANNWCSGPQNIPNGGGGSSTGQCTATGNPNFTNPDLSQVASKTLPDLTLRSASPAIDGGTYLTTATDAGANSTTLAVADALYFQDGTWGSDLARASAGLGGTMQADWICVGTVTNCVQINHVAYGTYSAPAGTLTLVSPLSWNNSASVWLYKKSDGAQVLYGAAPDYGASEYSSGKSPNPPTDLTGTVVQGGQ